MAKSVMDGMGFRGSTDGRSEEDQLLTDLPIIRNSSTEKASMSGSINQKVLKFLLNIFRPIPSGRCRMLEKNLDFLSNALTSSLCFEQTPTPTMQLSTLLPG